MPELGKLKQISQGSIRISSVASGVMRPVEAKIAHVDFPTTLYTGDYIFTPSDEVQTIAISGKTAEHDIVIEAVPSTYGHITWDGAMLTIY